MATIAQQPNQINGAYVPNVWVLDGLQATEDRYVLEVQIGGSTVATIKQPANPEGVGIFDVSKVLQSYLEPYFVELTTKATNTLNAHQTYQIRYGTETGNTVTIDGTSAQKFVLNSYDNWRTLNQDLSAFTPAPTDVLCETNSNINAVYARPFEFLTNWPESTYKVRSNEYKTLSFLTRNIVEGPNWGPNAAPFFVKFSNESNEYIYTLSTPNGTDLRSNCNDMSVTFNDDNSVVTIGAGPANIDGFFNVYTGYTVEVYSYDYCLTTSILDCGDVGEIIQDGYPGDVIFTATFEVDDTCERFDPVTVSFVNQYGVKDYYDFRKRNTSTTNITRTDYNKTLGTWSADTFSIDQHGRGKTTFSSEATTQVTLSTDWMEDSVSQWLQELYMSPSVQLYINGQWEPCTIVTSSYEEKTYARDFLFQHQITVQYANNQKIQRG